MDSKLETRLSNIEKQIEILRESESAFLNLEASKKAMIAKLTISAVGKSFAERESIALSSDDWAKFSAGHAASEVEFNYQRRRYELMLKAYDAEHLTLKTESPVIKRQGA